VKFKMPTPNEIRNTAKKVSENQGKLKQKNGAALNDSNKVNIWRGEISVAYKDAYKKAQSKTGKLISDLGSLKMKLGSLASSVNTAENAEMKKRMLK